MVTTTPESCIVWVVASCTGMQATSPPRTANLAATLNENDVLAVVDESAACEGTASSPGLLYLHGYQSLLLRLPTIILGLMKRCRRYSKKMILQSMK